LRARGVRQFGARESLKLGERSLEELEELARRDWELGIEDQRGRIYTLI